MGHGNAGRERPDLAERNRQNAIHGMYKEPVYHCFQEMKSRCRNKRHHAYENYGGRGIFVCERWLEKKGQGFLNFIEDMGIPDKGLEIDRINNNDGYYKENCRWTTTKINVRNRRTAKMIEFNGETKCLAQWAEDLGIERKALQMRLKTWSIEKALTTPYKSYTKRKK